MTNLVNSLPTRTASDPGTFRVLSNANENNVITAAQIAVARSKYWNPKMWNGSTWVDLAASIPGDVNGDGNVTIADVSALIDLLLSSGTPTAGADVNGDGSVTIADVSALIDLLLN